MNVIAISGRLVRDPELRYTGDQKACCAFTIAVDRPGTREKTDFIDCIAWEKKAEFVSKYFKRGSRIEVSGIITSRSYDAKDGGKRKAVEVRCDQAFFGDSKREQEGSQQGSGTYGGYSAPASSGASDFEQIDDEDAQLPF